MPLNIKNSEAHEFAKKLSALTGKSITEVVTLVLRETLEKARYAERESALRLTEELDDIAVHCASLPVLDSRTPDEILGYDDIGVPE